MAKLGEYGEKLETMTAQEVFNVGCDHLLTQGEKSDGGDGEYSCVYNGDDNLCCAAAPFIQEYSHEMEDHSWSQLCDLFGQPSNQREIIQLLQRVHDNCPVSEWPVELSRLGHSHKLKPTKLLIEKLEEQGVSYAY